MTPVSSSDPLPGSELASFVAVAETRSMQAAAEALSLTQSATSKRIQKLEARLGARLFDRGPRGVDPTRAGRVLYPHAREALSALARAEAQVRDLDAERLTLAASVTVGDFLLPGWLAAFRAVLPDVAAEVEVSNSTTVLEALRSGDVEIGFVGSRGALRGLRTLDVAEDELFVVVAGDHGWARRGQVSPRTLLRERYYTREPASATRAIAAAALRPAGVELRPALEARSSETLKQAVRQGGFTIISGLAVREEVAAGTLAAVGVRGVDLSRKLRAVTRRQPLSGRTASLFWAWLETNSGALAGLRAPASSTAVGSRGRSRQDAGRA